MPSLPPVSGLAVRLHDLYKKNPKSTPFVPLSPTPTVPLLKAISQPDRASTSTLRPSSNGGFLSPIKPQPLRFLTCSCPSSYGRRCAAMDMAGEEEEYAYEYEFDLENPFTSPADEPIASLLDAEAHHSPSVSAAASANRRAAAGFISKVRYYGELAVHPRVAYLALNYVDRFLSKSQLPFEHKPWAPRLLAISCLSIAAKMQRVAAISIADIQRDEEFMFDAVTIRRMERVVLGALEWRARSVTPLAFLGFFLSACFPPPRHPSLLDAVKERAVDLLLRAQPEVKMAEFSPSVVAASALLAAAGEVAGSHLPAFQAGVAGCHFEKLRECGEVMAAACGAGPGWTAASTADTPVTVLGHGHYRSASSESDRTVGSVADAKKRCMGPPAQWG